MHLITEPIGIRWVSWSRGPGSGGSYSILRHPHGELLGSAHEAVLLRPSLGVEQVVPAVGRRGVEEDVEQRDVGRLDREHRPADGGEGFARRLGLRDAPDPGGEALLVQALSLLGLPREHPDRFA